MKKLEEMLNKVQQTSDSYYTDIIAMHNHKALRGLSQTRRIEILKPKYELGKGLYFGGSGFYTVLHECIERGDMYESGRYKSHVYNFEVKDSVLSTKTHAGKYELLGLFPELTPDTIEDKLCLGVNQLAMYEGKK